MTGIKDYLYDRRESFIQRWHAEPILRPESLAEHNYFVARNSIMICYALKYYGIAEPDVASIALMAICHDEMEKETGDISGKSKRLYPQLKSTLKNVEFDIIYDKKMYLDIPEAIANEYLTQAFRLHLKEAHDLEAQIISYVDILEAHLHAKMEASFGNSNLEDAICRTTEWMQELDWPWLRELRMKIDLP